MLLDLRSPAHFSIIRLYLHICIFILHQLFIHLKSIIGEYMISMCTIIFKMRSGTFLHYKRMAYCTKIMQNSIGKTQPWLPTKLKLCMYQIEVYCTSVNKQISEAGNVLIFI